MNSIIINIIMNTVSSISFYWFSASHFIILSSVGYSIVDFFWWYIDECWGENILKYMYICDDKSLIGVKFCPKCKSFWGWQKYINKTELEIEKTEIKIEIISSDWKRDIICNCNRILKRISSELTFFSFFPFVNHVECIKWNRMMVDDVA